MIMMKKVEKNGNRRGEERIFEKEEEPELLIKVNKQSNTNGAGQK